MMRKRTHRWIFVLLIFALLFLTACTPQEPSESPPESGSAAESQDAESWIPWDEKENWIQIGDDWFMVEE